LRSRGSGWRSPRHGPHAPRWSRAFLPAQDTSAEVTVECGAGHGEAEPHDQRLDLGHVLRPRGLVRAALEPPVLIARGALRAGASEHVEPTRIPAIDRRLRR